jgi:hypothetical protein
MARSSPGIASKRRAGASPPQSPWPAETSMAWPVLWSASGAARKAAGRRRGRRIGVEIVGDAKPERPRPRGDSFPDCRTGSGRNRRSGLEGPPRCPRLGSGRERVGREVEVKTTGPPGGRLAGPSPGLTQLDNPIHGPADGARRRSLGGRNRGIAAEEQRLGLGENPTAVTKKNRGGPDGDLAAPCHLGRGRRPCGTVWATDAPLPRGNSFASPSPGAYN